ncbi:hypothetical protein [Dyella mobilis]|uniref:J domain-containing protein n=1 Tax=Dyella mobilis TaxID=1849582 RepID=A0ABS2KF79_9GAMM|nr:hypothetical protein [Dyella mobilis]MBM7129520.1 hypothetical protein [Dyella mobilis]GLQ98215.1 hypothetical protein GCM10007863_26350 [Dyella mobilis]
MDLFNATAADLLAASDSLWETALPAAASDRLMTLRRLAGRWHPDHCADPDAGAVFARIQLQRRHVAGDTRTLAADRRATEAHPVFASTMAADGRRWTMPYVASYADELGTVYIGRRTLLEVVSPDLADLAARNAAQTAHWRFVSSDMERQIRPCLPAAATVHRTADAVLVVRSRDPDLIRLADVVAHVGTVPPAHVAWIGSGLWNLACYLEYAQRAHPVIDASTVWIDTARHRVALLGGWAYAGALGERWAALPASALADVTPVWRSDPVQRSALGHIKIRRLLRELLGDVTGMGPVPACAPAPLAAFARSPAAGTAVEQYRSWQKAIEAAFGPRRFSAWNLPPTLIYPEN